MVTAGPSDFDGGYSIGFDGLSPVLMSVETRDGRHVLLNDPTGRHRLWFVGGFGRRGRAFLIPFDDDFSARLAQRPASAPSFDRRDSPDRNFAVSGFPLGNALDFTFLLRVLDGEQEGMTRRELAAVLLDEEARDIPAVEWKNSPLRKRINRAVTAATALMNGGYLALLRGEAERAERFQRR